MWVLHEINGKAVWVWRERQAPEWVRRMEDLRRAKGIVAIKADLPVERTQS